MTDFAQSSYLLLECAWKLAGDCALALGLVLAIVGVIYLFYGLPRSQQ